MEIFQSLGIFRRRYFRTSEQGVVYFCSVVFDEGYKTYYYLTDDDSIEIGDSVLVPAGKDKLDNFVWFDYIRPLDKDDIFNWRGKKVEDQLKKNVRKPVELPNQHLFEKKE